MLPNAMPRWVLCVLGFYRGRKIRAAHYTYFRKLSNVLFTNPENFYKKDLNTLCFASLMIPRRGMPHAHSRSAKTKPFHTTDHFGTLFTGSRPLPIARIWKRL